MAQMYRLFSIVPYTVLLCLCNLHRKPKDLVRSGDVMGWFQNETICRSILLYWPLPSPLGDAIYNGLFLLVSIPWVHHNLTPFFSFFLLQLEPLGEKTNAQALEDTITLKCPNQVKCIYLGIHKIPLQLLLTILSVQIRGILFSCSAFLALSIAEINISPKHLSIRLLAA